jgi:hypothetical protein
MKTTTTHPLPTPDQLIAALGGPSEVARLISAASKDEPITPQAVMRWRTAGIPTSRLVELALAKGNVLRSVTDVEPTHWHRLFPELKAASAA